MSKTEIDTNSHYFYENIAKQERSDAILSMLNRVRKIAVTHWFDVATAKPERDIRYCA